MAIPFLRGNVFKQQNRGHQVVISTSLSSRSIMRSNLRFTDMGIHDQPWLSSRKTGCSPSKEISVVKTRYRSDANIFLDTTKQTAKLELMCMVD